MNICKHCGFTGEPEDFRNPTGKICKECYNKQRRENRKKNRERINKQEREYRKKNKEKNNKKRRKNRKENREEINRKEREYHKKNQEVINKQTRKRYQENTEHMRQLRKKSYYKNHEIELERNRKSRRKRGILHWSEIKNLRLGLYIEKIIASIFGSVAEPYNNPNIDFICPSGYKMQVKVSSIHYNHGKPIGWSFGIKKNKVADYFILVAVNNTEDINEENFKPVHMWLMKGYLLNYKTGTSIALSRISKWDDFLIMEEYENKFIACCDIIKESEKKGTINK